MYCPTTQSAYFGPYDVEFQAGVLGRAEGSQRLNASRFSMSERLDERMKDIE
jgi:hypothetical protein